MRGSLNISINNFFTGFAVLERSSVYWHDTNKSYIIVVIRHWIGKWTYVQCIWMNFACTDVEQYDNRVRFVGVVLVNRKELLPVSTSAHVLLWKELINLLKKTPHTRTEEFRYFLHCWQAFTKHFILKKNSPETKKPMNLHFSAIILRWGRIVLQFGEWSDVIMIYYS